MPEKTKRPEKKSAPPASKKRKPRFEDRPSGSPSPANERYIELSRRYKAAKYLTFFLLVAFIFGMLTVNRDDITVENLRYLVRYIEKDSGIYSYPSGQKKIAYSADTEIGFEMFRDDFVIADSTAVNIYSLSGLNVLNESSFISNPVIKTSERHLLVYDLGGNSYALYNTFSKLFGETLPYPITGAANSADGLYALVTKTQEYRSAVYVYDRDFRLISRILKDKLVMDISVKPDGSEILIVSAYNSDGEFITEIMTCDPYSDKASVLIEHRDTLPLKASYTDRGFTVLCDKRLLFYDDAGILKGTFDFEGEIPVYSRITEKYTFVSFAENIVGNAQRLLIFDSEGQQTAEKRTEDRIIKLQCPGEYFYALTSDSIIRTGIGTGTSETYAIEKNSIDLITADENTLFLCYPGYAVSVDIPSAFPASAETAVRQAEPSETAGTPADGGQ